MVKAVQRRSLGEAKMVATRKAKELILQIFEEEALVIGGLAAMHGFDDELLWGLMRNLDVILGKALASLEENSPKRQATHRTNVRPHPAVEEFLSKLKRISGPRDA